MKKVTLQLSDGRKMTFSEHEIVTIVEEHLSNTKQVPTSKVAQKPTEDKWFEVKPQTINQNLFKKKRNNIRQEETRKLILEAFTEMKNNPEKYGKNFKTMMPKKKWQTKTVAELKYMACKLGHHNADWVEQALEWAQRITNGESWEDICNNPDTANWYRLVVWKKGYSRLVGGSIKSHDDNSASNLFYQECTVDYYLSYTIPLVISYE